MFWSVGSSKSSQVSQTQQTNSQQLSQLSGMSQSLLGPLTNANSASSSGWQASNSMQAVSGVNSYLGVPSSSSSYGNSSYGSTYDYSNPLSNMSGTPNNASMTAYQQAALQQQELAAAQAQSTSTTTQQYGTTDSDTPLPGVTVGSPDNGGPILGIQDAAGLAASSDSGEDGASTQEQQDA